VTGVFTGKAPENYVVITPSQLPLPLYAGMPNTSAGSAAVAVFPRQLTAAQAQIGKSAAGSASHMTDRRFIVTRMIPDITISPSTRLNTMNGG
jgi:hypothetical protein